MTNYIRATTLLAAGVCAAALMVTPVSAGIPFLSHTEQGVIQNIDTQSNKLTVFDSHANAGQDFTWNQDTKFREHTKMLGRSRTIAASDLKPGEEVKVYYKPGNEHTLARKVIVTHAAPPVTSEKPASGQT